MVKPGYKQTELGVIPEDWKVSKLRDIGHFKNGINKDKDKFGYGVSIIGLMDIFGVNYIDSTVNSGLVDASIYEQEDYSVKEGDVLFVRSSVKPSGVGLTAVVTKDLGNVVFSGFLLRYRTNDLTNGFKRYVFSSSYFRRNVIGASTVSANTNINQDSLKQLSIAYPVDEKEQNKIAEALSDVDSMISSLEKLIAKKKAVKQGAMQELLTGKKRLPGFTGEWHHEPFGKLCTICRGGSPRPIQDYLTTSDSGINWIKIGDVKPNAKYITSTQEKIVESGVSMSRRVYKGDFILSNSMSFGRPYILKLDGCIHDGWLAIQDYQVAFDTDFLYYVLGSNYVFEQYIQMAAGSSVQNLNKEKVAQLKLYIPALEEQTAIASILSDMDNEIEALEQKLAKTRQIKQGMMQQLLTGKIRLIEANADEKPVEVTPKPQHNHQFDDAVVIAAIVNAFYTDKFPLGRKKVQKLLYLLRRKQAGDTSAFKKKAAGPYADEIRYKGGEPIAVRNKYIATKKGEKGTAFEKGEKTKAALAYIEEWGMSEQIDWLVSTFKYTKTNDLELYATIDMAICDLKNAGEEISVASIKKLIASNEKWKAKLSKSYFTDSDIERAISFCQSTFN